MWITLAIGFYLAVAVVFVFALAYRAKASRKFPTSLKREEKTAVEMANGINNIEFSATPVPEPSTYLAGLSALGMLGLFGWKHRK